MDIVRERAEAEISLSEKHGFPLFVAVGTLHKGERSTKAGPEPSKERSKRVLS
jgi:hypothetical protein